MKVASIALLAIFSDTSVDAIGFRELVNKFSGKSNVQSAHTAASEPAADIESDAELAAFLQDLEAPPAAIHANGSLDEDSRRNLVSANCATQAGFFVDWSTTNWATGTCSRGVQCFYNNYPTVEACCANNFLNQPGAACYIAAGFAPTYFPTSVAELGTGSTGTAGFFYPDYDTAWSEATCLNTLPLPYVFEGDRPTYTTMLACCKGAYGGQMSGACLAELPNPPTTSPSISGGILGFFYPDYDTTWSVAGCSNEAPLPYPRRADRPSYDTMLACCKGAYGGQISGTCLAALPNPPTTSPSMSGGVLDFYYPDYDTAWSVAGCSNEAPLPYPRRADRPSYDTLDACCTGAFGGQVSGVCVSGFCKTGDNNGFLKFPSWADAAKLEEAFPFSKGGIIMDQKQLDAEFCVEKGVTIVSTGANTLVGVSPFLSTERFAPETITDDEIKAVCFAKCSKNKDCDYISIILSTLAGGDSLCHIYSFAANKPGFKISPFVDEFTTTAIALKKNVNLRDSAEMECDVPGDGNKLVAAILCGAGLGCQPGAESLVTTDLQQLILPALGCIMAGGGGALGCLTCLTREVSQSCVTVAEGICALDSSENFITGACSVDCNIPTPDPAFGGDRCKALMQTAMLCAKGAPRTSFLTIPGEPAFQVGGGCVNSGYDTITPRFTCPIV